MKSPKMVLCKSRIELSLVRPGLIAVQDKVASVKLNEDRMDLLKITAMAKAKGMNPSHLFSSKDKYINPRNQKLFGSTLCIGRSGK